MKISKLTRLAFVWAEQDRTALSKCWPKGSPQRKEAEEQAAALRSYRLGRWGRTLGDKLDDVKPRPLSEAAKRGDKQTEGWVNVILSRKG